MDESDCEPQRRRGPTPLNVVLVLTICSATPALAQSGGPAGPVETSWTGADLLLVLALIAVNGLFAMAEVAFLTVRRTRIEQLVEEGNRAARIVATMLSEPTRTLSTIQVGITFVGLITAGAAADSAVEPIADWIRSVGGGTIVASYAQLIAFVGVMVCVTFLTLVLGEITPKSLAVQRSEPIILAAAYPLRVVQVVAAPAVAIVTRIADMLVRPFGGKAAFHPTALSQEELKMMVEQSEEYGVIEPQEKEMIHSIFEFSDTPVRRVMTPRLDITAVSADTPVLGIIDAVKKSGHSRLPVYDDDLDQIVGIVHVKDAIDELAGTGHAPVRDLMRPPYFVPESKRVDDLLADFRRNKSHLAIVRDEYGTVTGVVTIEDLLEEIVGEIQDEYDLEEPEVTQVDASTMIVDGRMTVAD
ncbi:MAG: HlyC/CorC family transporter, partial [Armatimonadetes bacterium]|nr:HlyC/CorC family transporter [Armatimonadota bacterium]